MLVKDIGVKHQSTKMCKEVTTQGKQQEKVKEHVCMEEDFVLTIYGKPASQPRWWTS
jgi:hypothetical protein